MKKHFLLLCLFTILSAQAQLKWYNPQQADFPAIQNQGWPQEIGNTYTRLPERAHASVRTAVWDLSRNSAGLAVYFYSNAPEIKIRYAVSGSFNMPHMPSTGVSGIDMYRINSDGQWGFCFGNYSFGDTIQYSFANPGKDTYHNRGFEYRVYLPLYNSVKWMEIGIPDSSELTFVPQSAEKPIVLYGTSIAQGACASRPAMAWGNIVQRSMGYPLINLGFSGNGQLEEEVLHFISEQDARLYILDCLPNLTQKSDEEVTRLVIDAVKQLRKTHTAPILLVEHAGYSNAPTNSDQRNSYTRLNQASRKGFDSLRAENIQELYYLSHDELNFPADGWVDSVHPSDLGMQMQATAVEKKVREILNMPQGDLQTNIPVTQRREPNTYEWQKRHQEILNHMKQNPPKAVILGNSITHFWAGAPQGPLVHGSKSWTKTMHPAGFQNLGYGFDRIENVLWRVYHGELDGYEAEKVVLMIGTNNLDINSDEEIVDGLRFLMHAIRDRQPKASLKIMGILPRRSKEDVVKKINLDIQQMAQKEGYAFCDVSTSLLKQDGKIDESLFIDGLHPNEKGYERISPRIAE